MWLDSLNKCYGRTRFREIWVSDDFRTDILYCTAPQANFRCRRLLPPVANFKTLSVGLSRVDDILRRIPVGSDILSALLGRVMLISFEHLPSMPFPLYSLNIFLCNQLFGMVSCLYTCLIICLGNSLVAWPASIFRWVIRQGINFSLISVS